MSQSDFPTLPKTATVWGWSEPVIARHTACKSEDCNCSDRATECVCTDGTIASEEQAITGIAQDVTLSAVNGLGPTGETP